MKKSILLAYIALFITFLPPIISEAGSDKSNVPEEPEQTVQTEAAETAPAEPVLTGRKAPEKIKLLDSGTVKELSTDEYIKGVVAAEMPADFPEEALKAQAVAARSYAMYCAETKKHGDAQVCSDFACCQAWISEDTMRKNWGENFDANFRKISSAVEDTSGQYLSYEGRPVFAAFHSSSAGATEDCGEVWNPRPYLVSVESPENELNVPGFLSTLECAPIDFRDCILSVAPDADFSGEESGWIGDTVRDDSGRVRSIVLGGAEIKGPELRKLFSLRSTSFSLEYRDGCFVFSVRGFGHGVGMSQYGAKLMAENGSSYREILSHYYSGAALTE